MARNDTELDSSARKKLATLRNRVAGMIKNLVAARANEDREWCKKFNIDGNWFFSTNRPKKTPLARLLSSAAAALGRIREEYYGGLNSIADEHRDYLSQGAEGENLMDLLCQFVKRSELEVWAERASADQSIGWEKMARWDLLPKLREILDGLPELAKEESELTANSPIQFGAISVDFDRQGITCPGRVCDLLRFLSQKRDYSCEIRELAEPIWGDSNKMMNEDISDDVQCETNKWLKARGIPLKLSRKKRIIRVVELPSDPVA